MVTDEIDLGDLLRSIRQNWLVILACTALSIILALVYLHVATYHYAVTLQVTPASGSGERSSLTSKLGSLASVAGVSLPMNQSEEPFELYLNGLTSRVVAEKLTRNDEIMRRVFASEWDESQQRWIEPSGFATTLKNTIQRVVGVPKPKWSPPDAARLHQYLAKNIDIAKSKENSIVEISFLTPDPDFGIVLINAISSEMDLMLRNRAALRSSAYIEHLQQQLQNVNVADYRAALLAVLAEQEKVRMLASSKLPFAAEPFGEPVPSRNPVSPNPILILALALMGGVSIGVILSIFRQ